MSSSFGENIRLTLFGQSHSEAVGMTLDGIPAGERLDMDRLTRFLARRAPVGDVYSTARREPDIPEFLCGLTENIFCGAPVTAIIRNTDARPHDYEAFKNTPRPGHADYTAQMRYGGHNDRAGGGHLSGRLTAPLCIAGGICLQLLEKEGVEIISRIASIGAVSDNGELTASTAGKHFPVVDDTQGEKMLALIGDVKKNGNSVGGIIECAALGLPAGVGDPIFGGMENRIAQIIFGIPAVKGIEFGAGFSAAKMTGSENNDEFCLESGILKTKTNNCGGLLGGITNGMPLTFRVAVKPTPSIAVTQKSVDLTSGSETEIKVTGRHDACIVPRAVPCVEAAAAIAIYDALLGRRRG